MKRRWLRLVTPIAVVFLIITGTVLVRWLAEPDYSEQHYLSPNTAGDSSSVGLAKLVHDKGIAVQRETITSEALKAAWSLQGRATLFIPAPEFVHGDYLWMLRHSPPGTRVVLVEPGSRQLADAVPSLGIADTRWATAVTSPGADCPLTKAGRAAVTRTRYGEWSNRQAQATFCYENGLAAVIFDEVEFVLAGSNDPFRADRIAEHDNANLAVDLLSARPTLIWLDLHTKDPKPKTNNDEVPGVGAPVPSLGPGDERARGGSPRPRPSRSAIEDEEPGNQAAEPPSPFPRWLLPAAVMLFLAALALALARGWRLGAPVSEPLPIEVRGAETAIGRGNLYRRAKARGAALETLRVDARRRIGIALGLPPHALPDAYRDILYGPEPDNDQELERRTRELLALVERITKGEPQ